MNKKVTFLISPLADAGSAIAYIILDGLCYQYKNDCRNRQTETKLLAKEWEYIAYDNQDRTVVSGNVHYIYKPNSNILTGVTDYSGNTSGFKDGNIVGDDYTYDANGNMITDKNKGITEIIYNHLNLPTKITFGATGTISYIYNALGQKLQK